jgi:D-tyrosyl-tRNA(Tyr) deacylase
MRAVIQRVTDAQVVVDAAITGKIGSGLLVLFGVAKPDTQADVEFLVDKILNLRIFSDAQGKMNLSLLDTAGSLLVVSQFTLYGDCRKGRRPGFDAAAPPDLARSLYEKFIDLARLRGVHVEAGIFQAHMEVSLVNDGPVTLILETNGTA